MSSIYFMEKERNMVNHLNYYYFTNVFTPEELEKIKKLGDEIIGQFPSGKKPSEAAYAVYCFVCETFTGFPIPARECYRKSSLRTQYGLNAEMTEQIFDELQSFGLGMKIVEEINNFKSVKFDPNLDNLQFTNTN